MIIRDTLTANRTYYVRTDGSDSNTGLTNDASGAFLTIQHAVDVVCDTLDNMGYSVTIQVADGAYNAAVVLKPYVGSGAATLQGNTSTPANVTITLSSGHCISAHYTSQLWTVQGFKLSTTGSGGSCLRAFWGKIAFSSMDFGSCVASHILADQASYIVATGNYSISGGAAVHVNAGNGSLLSIGGRTLTITGTPAFSSAFAQANYGQLGAGTVTFSGSATGPRYIAVYLGLIYTNSGGANYFPGNSAGSTSNGGLYT